MNPTACWPAGPCFGTPSIPTSANPRALRRVIYVPSCRRTLPSRNAPAVSENVMAAPEGPGSIRRILVVEDNADGREILRLLLELWGYEVGVAADGLEGVEMALRWRPDAAV